MAGNDPKQIACSMGIMAHNEERNIGRLLETVVSQRAETMRLTEIIVIASGCTDNTESIVQRWGERDRRIQLRVQAHRQGKAAAINHFIAQAREEILVLCSADLLLGPDTVEQVLLPLSDSGIGMTTCRPIPVNSRETFMGFAAHLLWDSHHQINLTEFKAGELVAFRKTFNRISSRTAVDEASIESIIRGEGREVRYVGNAIVQNRGPETLRDFLGQRRRIYAGHLALREAVGYTVATMSGLKILAVVLRNLDWRPRYFVQTWMVASLEIYGRFLGWCDYKRRRDHSIWQAALTTKDLEPALCRQQLAS